MIEPPPAPSVRRYANGTDAARIATLFADALVLAGLLLLGTRLRPGEEGRLLGVALAYAWATYPYALFEIRYSSNNTVVLTISRIASATLAVRRELMLQRALDFLDLEGLKQVCGRNIQNA